MADLVYVQKLDWRSAEPLVESLRIDEDDLEQLTSEIFDEVGSAYGTEGGAQSGTSRRVERFLSGLRRDLGH